MGLGINLIGLSSGKDSTALLGWAIHESGYPRESIVAAFCDTENEYDEVYQQIKDLNRYCIDHGVSPILTLKPKGAFIDQYPELPAFLALAKHRKRFPSAKARFCTSSLKIIPTEELITLFVNEWCEVVSHSGVRATESIERSVMPEWDTDLFGCKTRRPLLAWSIGDVWDAHRKWGLPINPLYRDGWKRVGCRLCVMSNKADVYRTKTKRPWVIDMYRDWELVVGGELSKFSGFFTRSQVPLAQRSKMVNTKKGEMLVATIDDVARWSSTSRGGVQQVAPFMLEEEDFNVDDAHAPCQSGYCE